jgi:dienelactone hydrolase
MRMERPILDVLVARRQAGGVPLLDLVPRDPKAPDARYPLVILVHGYSNFKELNLAQGYHVARGGFRVLLPDAWNHGERAAPGTIDFVEACTRTAAEVDGLIDAWAREPGVDASRVGLGGFSMGGCITFAYLAGGGRKVTAAASVIGSPDWVSVFESPDAKAQAAELGVPADPAGRAAYLARVRAAEPAGRLDAFAAVPFLVQVGALDTLVPAAPVGAFCERLAKRYPDPSLLRYVAHPNVGHGETIGMNLALAGWFIQHLGGQR